MFDEKDKVFKLLAGLLTLTAKRLQNLLMNREKPEEKNQLLNRKVCLFLEPS